MRGATEGLARLGEALADDRDAPNGLRNQALGHCVLLALKQGDTGKARQWAERQAALAEESGEEETLASALNSLGIVLTVEGRFGEARSSLERSLAINERLGNTDKTQAGLHNLGLISIGEGAYDDAFEKLTSALEVANAMGDERSASNDQTDRAFALIGLGRWREARADASESLLTASRLGWPENVAYCLVALAAVAVAAEEAELAARVLGQADRLAEEVRFEFQDYAERRRVETYEALQSRLPGSQLDSLLSEGRTWSVDEAATEALGRSLD